jgi:hypothetical protein
MTPPKPSDVGHVRVQAVHDRRDRQDPGVSGASIDRHLTGLPADQLSKALEAVDPAV